VKSKYCSNHKPQPCRLQGQRHTPHNRMQSFNQWTYNVQNIIGLHYWVYCLLHVNIIEVLSSTSVAFCQQCLKLVLKLKHS